MCLIRTGDAIGDAASGEVLGIQNFVHMIAPASPTRLHHFVNTARTFGLDNPALAAMDQGMGTRIQPEDIDAIETIESILQSGATLPAEISARIDNGALKVRRRLEKQILVEMASQPVTPLTILEFVRHLNCWAPPALTDGRGVIL